MAGRAGRAESQEMEACQVCLHMPMLWEAPMSEHPPWLVFRDEPTEAGALADLAHRHERDDVNMKFMHHSKRFQVSSISSIGVPVATSCSERFQKHPFVPWQWQNQSHHRIVKRLPTGCDRPPSVAWML